MSIHLLRFPQVKQIVGLSRSTIFRLERNGNFPKRRQISAGAVGWLSSEIENWVKSKQEVQHG